MSDTNFTKYSINPEVQFQPLQLIDITALISKSNNQWQNISLCEVNDCVIRLGVIEGEFHWHKHENEDEFFYVIEGKLCIDFKEKTIELLPNQSCVVPRQILHKTRAPVRTSILMIEGKTVIPTGN